MGLEVAGDLITMTPGPIDVHAHPRVFDPLPDGKAGLEAYTKVMLESGITVMLAMPNEARRVLNDETGQIEQVQYPISNPDRVGAMETAISSQSRTLAGIHLGIDKKEVLSDNGREVVAYKARRLFYSAGRNASGLKLWVDLSTGGMNVSIDHASHLVDEWNTFYPEKPTIVHAEDGNVRAILAAIAEKPNGNEIPIHIAHVSSREELEAVIEAKENGMRVTCEVTPHHLFATAAEVVQINGFGCVKPRLKTAEDVQFLWDNMKHIDVFASDCAPHRLEEKEAENPAFGVTNHTVMMPLLLGAVSEGRITLDDLYQKIVVTPREIFNISMDDGTSAVFDMGDNFASIADAERTISPPYGQNMFEHLEQIGALYHLAGRAVHAVSGDSEFRWGQNGTETRNYQVSLRHLVKCPR